MKLPFTTTRPWLVFGIPTAVLCTSLFILLSGWAKHNPMLYAGVTYDLVLTLPLSLYFLSGRKLPKMHFGLLVGFGMLICWLCIPVAHQFHLSLLRFTVIPLLELLTLVGLILFARNIRKELRKSGKTATDHLQLFKWSGQSVTGNKALAQFLGTELAMCYYALGLWRKRSVQSLEYTYYRDSGIVALLWALVFLVGIETAAVHLIVERYSVVAAWILTALSIYSVLFLLAHIKAVKHRPHSLEPDHLMLRNGMFGTAVIPYEAIASVELTSAEPAESTQTILRFVPFGGKENHSVVLQLKETVEVETIYGFRKKCDVLLLQIDDKHAFLTALHEKMEA